MVRVTSLTENEIREIGNAFANHSYSEGEFVMHSHFKNSDAVRNYICDYVMGAIKRGNPLEKFRQKAKYEEEDKCFKGEGPNYA